MSLPTPEQISSITSNLKARFEEGGLDNFYKSDIEKLFSEKSAYLSQFWIHQAGWGGDQEKNTVDMIIKTLSWRKQFEIESIKEDEFTKSMKERGLIYSHNRDKNQNKLLVVAMKKHIKGEVDLEQLKRFGVYYLERLDREEKGGQLTVVYDGTGLGFRNIDMELYQFVVKLFLELYPNKVDYTLFYEMPWVFTASWNIIKLLIPAKVLEKIKFVNKDQIKQYIDDDNLPVAWGGKDTKQYVFQPEDINKTE